MGAKLTFSSGQNNFYNVSLGQGQEIVAEEALEVAAKNGHWVVLQVSITCVSQLDRSVLRRIGEEDRSLKSSDTSILNQ